MMRYLDFAPPPSHAPESFWASIQKIDAQLRHDPYRWTLNIAARQDPASDYKVGKVRHYMGLIQAGAAIIPPEFVARGDYVDIMDGRHRIYALHDTGHTEIRICCSTAHKARLLAALGV